MYLKRDKFLLILSNVTGISLDRLYRTRRALWMAWSRWRV